MKDHLKQYAWYLPHQAWLAAQGLPHHDPEGTDPQRANLARANLARANLDGAILEGANLNGAILAGAILEGANLAGAILEGANLAGASLNYAYLNRANLDGANLNYAYLNRANLAGANLDGANLADANLEGAILEGASFAGCSGQPDYSSIVEAIDAVRSWLTQERWIQSKWIETPDGAYAGNCRACLHGAAVYIGGSYGPQISQALVEVGYTTSWNDNSERTHDEVIEALASLAYVWPV